MVGAAEHEPDTHPARCSAEDTREDDEKAGRTEVQRITSIELIDYNYAERLDSVGSDAADIHRFPAVPRVGRCRDRPAHHCRDQSQQRRGLAVPVVHQVPELVLDFGLRDQEPIVRSTRRAVPAIGS